jgi:hypothetical protein
MAAEIQIGGITTGWTVYAVVRSSTGTVLAGTTPEAFNAANWGTYDIPLTEQGSTGYYVGTFPAVAAGVYSVEVRRQTGGSPAAAVATDPYLGGGDVDWDGTVLRGAGYVRLAAGVLHGGQATQLELQSSGSTPACYIHTDDSPAVPALHIEYAGTTAGMTGSAFRISANAAAVGLYVSGAAADIQADITGNLSGSVGSVATNGLTAASLAPDAVAEIQGGLSTLTAAGLLAHEVGSGRTVSYYLSGGFNKTVRTATTFTVYGHDDTTPLATAVLTENGDREPVESIDP